MFTTVSNMANSARNWFRILVPIFNGFNKGQQHQCQIHTAIYEQVRFQGLVPVVPQRAGSQDILLQKIGSAKESSEVLNSVNRHHAIMNSQHVLQALRSLFNLQKSQNSYMSNGEVINNKDFQKLCKLLKFQIRHLELDQLIDVAKFLGYLGVSADTKILNIVFNLISKQVNSLSLQQITFIDFIMRDLKQTPLVKAMNIALPIVFESNLKSKCDFNDIPQMCNLLLFAAKRKHMETSIDTLVDAMVEQRHRVTAKDAKDIVYAVCFTKHFNDNVKLLLCHALDTLTDSVNEMDYYEIESVLTRLCMKYCDTDFNPSYYHEEFCNACLKTTVENNHGFERSLWILRKTLKFNHCNLPVLKYIAAEAERQPWLLEQCGATGLICFLNGLSAADYKPPNWSHIEPLVIKALQGLMDRMELPWIRIILDLCVLDCWHHEFFDKVFSREFLSTFMARDYNKLDRIQLCTLDQVVATLCPWPIKPRAPPDLVLFDRGKQGTDTSLQAALQHGFGGAEYVLSCLQTSLGHFIDFAVVIRKGGYPVAINLTGNQPNQIISTDDIQVPTDSKMVAIILVPSSMCAINTERVRGMSRLKVSSIEALGIPVAQILEPVWKSLPDFERIPYLMRAVKEKVTDSYYDVATDTYD